MLEGIRRRDYILAQQVLCHMYADASSDLSALASSFYPAYTRKLCYLPQCDGPDVHNNRAPLKSCTGSAPLGPRDGRSLAPDGLPPGTTGSPASRMISSGRRRRHGRWPCLGRTARRVGAEKSRYVVGLHMSPVFGRCPEGVEYQGRFFWCEVFRRP